jgi:hypothetical protein
LRVMGKTIGMIRNYFTLNTVQQEFKSGYRRAADTVSNHNLKIEKALFRCV